jgi:hypothetical protein
MGAIGGAASGSETAAQAGVGAMMGSIGLAWVAIVYGVVIQMVMIYKAWSAINDGHWFLMNELRRTYRRLLKREDSSGFDRHNFAYSEDSARLNPRSLGGGEASL